MAKVTFIPIATGPLIFSVIALATALLAGSASARGISGSAHFVGGGFGGHGFAIRHSFVRPFRRNFAFRKGFAFRRNFATGGWWPYYYDYTPTDAYGDMYTTNYPETGGFVPEPMPTPVCHRSEEIVRVPAEGGGTRQIKIVRCP
jgi:hypothetical protein